jgi:hypothetical protein
MFRFPVYCTIALLLACPALISCGGRGSPIGGAPPAGTAPIVLAMTDTPPTTVSILAAEVTLSGATLNPGNVSILAAPTTVELTRLQTDLAHLGTTNVVPGNYTSLTLTFANPSLTIENDTGSAIGSTCLIGAICTISPTTANLSTAITIPKLTAAAGTAQGLLVDVNLENLLSATLAADFKAGTTVSEFTPATNGPPLFMAEDVVGQVTAVDAAHNAFSFQNATQQYSLQVDSTTTFFPPSSCTTPAITCLQANQILSVDISFRADGTAVARNIVLEDSGNSDTEVEGMIVGTNLGSHEFTIVTLAESAAITGLKIGDTATVQYSASPPTAFDVDFGHVDGVPLGPSGFSFAPLNSPTDLFVGQQVQMRRNPSSVGTVISADRVRLRSSRITATVQPNGIAAPSIFLTGVPSLLSGHGITQIQALTVLPTIFSENEMIIPLTSIPVSGVVSVRGPLFNVGTTKTLVATKVVLKP